MKVTCMASRPLILTIDDEPGIRMSFRRYLSEFGYEVIEAGDGGEGLEVFEDRRPDLALVDLRMPGMDGIEVIAHIKEESPDTPVIVVSGTGNINDAIDALRLGAWDYLLKPLGDMAVLRHAVEKGLERARLLRENRAYQDHLEKEVERRTAELDQALVRLRENEKRYRTVAEFTYDWEYWELPDGAIEYVSPSCKRISGYEPDDFIADPSLFSRIVLPADRHVWQAHNHYAKSTPRLRETRFRIVTADGEVRWIEHVCQPVVDETGEFLGIRASNRDISERERLEAELRQAQKLEAIGTLAGGIAHDFNNILSAIFGYTELARMRAVGDSDLVEDLNQVYRAAERARELVKQILTFSRRGEQEKKPLQMALIVKEAMKLLRASIPSTIDIRQNIDSQATVLADPTQIHQVLMNLCTNAYQAIGDHSGTIGVSLRDTTLDLKHHPMPCPDMKPGRYVTLEISDTGKGMDGTTMEQIFEPYFTTKGPGEGSGLGLAVVHGIIRSHGGHIKVRSEPGRGSVFTVYLPASGKAAEDTVSSDPEVRGGRERIMFVDDEEQLTAMAARILPMYGYRVRTFADGAEAWREFAESPDDFDMVVTDMTMPLTTGVELAAKIKNLRPATPVILCSGFNESINRDDALDMGIDEYITKPLIMSRLAAMIRTLLDRPAAGRHGTPDNPDRPF